MSAVLKKVGTTPHWILKRESPPGFAQFPESAIHILPQLPPLGILYSFTGKLHPFTLAHPYHYFWDSLPPEGSCDYLDSGSQCGSQSRQGEHALPAIGSRLEDEGPSGDNHSALEKSLSLSTAVIPKCFVMCCTAHSKCKAVLIFDKAIPTIN